MTIELNFRARSTIKLPHLQAKKKVNYWRTTLHIQIAYFGSLALYFRISVFDVASYLEIYMRFTCWEVRIGRSCARGLEYRPRVQLLLIRTDLGQWITFLLFFLLRFKSFRKSLLQPPIYVCWSRSRSCWWSVRSIAKQNITTWFLACILYYHN